jgi:predicted secreted acid phosphatase
MGRLSTLRRAPWLVVLALVAVVAVAGAVRAATGPAIQTITPKSADDITNLDVLRQQIRNYYGDPLGTGVFAADSNYAKEAQGVAADGAKYLAKQAKDSHKKKLSGTPAVLLDVDDTTLATYNYEIFSNWSFNVMTNANFVTAELFPAVPGMVQMTTDAVNEGYKLIFLTGRPTSQADATIGNLTTDDLPSPPAIHNHYPTPTLLFTKPAAKDYATQAPWLVPCIFDTGVDADGNPKGCNTDNYKTLTRKHIEQDLGYDLVANFGDQFSDLNGGFADKTFKLPNPSYFLP